MRVNSDKNGKGEVTAASTDNTPGGPSATGVDDESSADADALALAEAEAEEAEARAAAAHARARAIRLRREAKVRDSDRPVESELTRSADADLDANAVPIDAEATAAEDQPAAAGDDETIGAERANETTGAEAPDSPVQIAGEPRRQLSGWRRRPGLKAIAVGLAVVVVLAALGA